MVVLVLGYALLRCRTGAMSISAMHNIFYLIKIFNTIKKKLNEVKNVLNKQIYGVGLDATKNNVYRRISLKRLWSRLKI